jgi:hypothetical protein
MGFKDYRMLNNLLVIFGCISAVIVWRLRVIHNLSGFKVSVGLDIS